MRPPRRELEEEIAEGSRPRQMADPLKPTADHRARARALVAALADDAEVLALVGNWRPVKVPPLAEFVRHCLIVEKETGKLIPFDLWPAAGGGPGGDRTRADKLVIPKGRQVGITWLELAAMLWAGTFWGHRLFPIARQSDEYAREAIVRLLILAGYDPTSEAGKPAPACRVAAARERGDRKIVGKTRRELRLANGSSYRALTATQPHRPRPGRLLGPRRRVRLLALAGAAAGGHGVGLRPPARGLHRERRGRCLRRAL